MMMWKDTIIREIRHLSYDVAKRQLLLLVQQFKDSESDKAVEALLSSVDIFKSVADVGHVRTLLLKIRKDRGQTLEATREETVNSSRRIARENAMARATPLGMERMMISTIARSGSTDCAQPYVALVDQLSSTTASCVLKRVLSSLEYCSSTTHNTAQLIKSVVYGLGCCCLPTRDDCILREIVQVANQQLVQPDAVCSWGAFRVAVLMQHPDETDVIEYFNTIGIINKFLPAEYLTSTFVFVPVVLRFDVNEEQFQSSIDQVVLQFDDVFSPFRGERHYRIVDAVAERAQIWSVLSTEPSPNKSPLDKSTEDWKPSNVVPNQNVFTGQQQCFSAYARQVCDTIRDRLGLDLSTALDRGIALVTSLDMYEVGMTVLLIVQSTFNWYKSADPENPDTPPFGPSIRILMDSDVLADPTLLSDYPYAVVLFNTPLSAVISIIPQVDVHEGQVWIGLEGLLIDYKTPDDIPFDDLSADQWSRLQKISQSNFTYQQNVFTDLVWKDDDFKTAPSTLLSISKLMMYKTVFFYNQLIGAQTQFTNFSNAFLYFIGGQPQTGQNTGDNVVRVGTAFVNTGVEIPAARFASRSLVLAQQRNSAAGNPSYETVPENQAQYADNLVNLGWLALRNQTLSFNYPASALQNQNFNDQRLSLFTQQSIVQRGQYNTFCARLQAVFNNDDPSQPLAQGIRAVGYEINPRFTITQQGNLPQWSVNLGLEDQEGIWFFCNSNAFPVEAGNDPKLFRYSVCIANVLPSETVEQVSQYWPNRVCEYIIFAFNNDGTDVYLNTYRTGPVLSETVVGDAVQVKLETILVDTATERSESTWTWKSLLQRLRSRSPESQSTFRDLQSRATSTTVTTVSMASSRPNTTTQINSGISMQFSTKKTNNRVNGDEDDETFVATTNYTPTLFVARSRERYGTRNAK